MNFHRRNKFAFWHQGKKGDSRARKERNKRRQEIPRSPSIFSMLTITSAHRSKTASRSSTVVRYVMLSTFKLYMPWMSGGPLALRNVSDMAVGSAGQPHNWCSLEKTGVSFPKAGRERTKGFKQLSDCPCLFPRFLLRLASTPRILRQILGFEPSPPAAEPPFLFLRHHISIVRSDIQVVRCYATLT